MDETKETEDIPPIAASVKTLQEAVKLSLKNQLTENCLFIFARALKAFEITNNRRLPPAELQSAFVLWWNAAGPLLPPGADFDEYRFDFEDTFAKTTAALGSNSLQEAIRLADASPLPPQAERYASPKLKRLVAVCYHLQLLQGPRPFFLGVREAGRITGEKSLFKAAAMLNGLVRDGILVEVTKGTRKRATRFRFTLPDSAPTDELVSPVAAKRTSSMGQGEPIDRAVRASPKSTKAKAERPPSTYELVERKKALQDLIKEFGHESGYDDLPPDEWKRLKKLEKELHQVTASLAGVTD